MVYSRLHLLGQLFLGWVTRWLYIPCPCFSSLLLVCLIDFETKQDWWITKTLLPAVAPSWPTVGKGTGLAVQFWLSKGEVMLPHADVLGQEVYFWAGDWLGLSRKARALLGSSDQFGRCWESYPKEKGSWSVWRKGGGGQGQSIWDEGGSPHSIRNLACLCSSGSQGPAAPQYCFWPDSGHELKQLVEKGWCRSIIFGVGSSKRLGFSHSKYFRESGWAKKNSAGLGVCSWEQRPCQFFPHCCHCNRKQRNVFNGISCDALASLLRFGRQRPCWCLSCLYPMLIAPEGHMLLALCLCNPAAVSSGWKTLRSREIKELMKCLSHAQHWTV